MNTSELRVGNPLSGKIAGMFFTADAAYALWFAYYNFCRRHSTLRVTPAMESGLTNRVWDLKDLIAN